MAILKELTSTSWILKSDSGDKLGLVGFMDGEYNLVATNIKFNFKDILELETALNEKLTVQKKVNIEIQNNEIDGYPISHEAVTDHVYIEGKIKYSPNTKNKSKKEYYAGIWATPNSETDLNTCYTRVSLSVDIYDKLRSSGIEPQGQFKDKMEANFACRQSENKFSK